ncbi:MAG: FecR domain-containing protein [Vulcanimicrobiaceae bacterium]
MRSTAAVMFVSVVMLAGALPGGTSSDMTLQRLAGYVGYQNSASSTVTMVAISQPFASDAYASTQAQSIAVLDFPDDSRVTLGGNSVIQVHALFSKRKRVHRNQDPILWEGSAIRLPSDGSVLRFDIHQPYDGQEMYVVSTRFARIAIRGTTALLADSMSGDILTCLDCGAGDIVADVGGNDFALLNNETLRIRASGRVTVEETNPVILQGFVDAGLSTYVPPPQVPVKPRPHWPFKL